MGRVIQSWRPIRCGDSDGKETNKQPKDAKVIELRKFYEFFRNPAYSVWWMIVHTDGV